MSIIEFEVEEIGNLCKNVIPNSTLVACTAEDPALIRVEIVEWLSLDCLNTDAIVSNIGKEVNDHQTANKFKSKRQVIVCLRFPKEYPKQPILIELKSRTLDEKFLIGLTSLCESQAKTILGKPQGLHVLKFVSKYLQDNPLCVCFDEIQKLKNLLILGDKDKNEPGVESGELKLKQRNSSITLICRGGLYFYKVKAFVPIDYPRSCVKLQDTETNLPSVLHRYLNGQSKEIARQCVEPPLNKKKQTKEPFQPIPSLYRVLKFCLDATKDFHNEICPICKELVLPRNPKEIITDDSLDGYVERVYCGHLFHQGCLKKYMSEPPFPKGGKLCPATNSHSRSDSNNYLLKSNKNDNMKKATKCGERLAHDRWVVNVKLAESKWAQKQAKERELQEVMDFLK